MTPARPSPTAAVQPHDAAAASVRLVRADDAARVARAVRTAPVVAIDTEFHTEGRYRPDLLLVQLHVPGEGIFLVDPLDPGPLAEVGAALGEAAAWLVHGGRQDLRLLLPLAGRVPDVVWDTQVAAGLVGTVYRAGLDALVEAHLGRELTKDVRMADWSRRPLPEAQLAYAAEDVRWLPTLWATLAERAAALGREAAVVAACGEVRDATLHGDPSDDAFRYLVRDVDLDPVEATVLRELARWRDEAADEIDKPPPYVLSDALLRELARSQPTTVETLARHRRLSDRVAGRHGRAIVAAVARGRERAERAPEPVLRASGPEARRLAWLGVLATDVGARATWAAGLVLPRDRLEALARLPAPGPDGVARILGPWRSDVVGDEICAALAGRTALALSENDVVPHRLDANRDKQDAS
jgi:ribonuclease D